VRRIAIILVGWICLTAIAVHAAHTQVRLILFSSTEHSGSRVAALVDLKMEPGWHTYWKNPGAAGMATKIDWQLPPGLSVVDSGWPVPKKFPPVDVTTYGYEDEVALPTILEIASNSPPGRVEIKAHVSWLECKEVCIPASADVEATLQVVSPDEEIKTTPDTESLRVISLWEHSMPLRQDWQEPTVRAWWGKPADGDTRPFVIEWAGIEHQPDFYPDADDHYEIQGATEMFPAKSGNVGLRKLVKKFDGDWPKEISGLLVMPRDPNTPARTNDFRNILAWNVKLPVSETVPTNFLTRHDSRLSNEESIFDLEWQELFQMLLYAFIGGLILNIMPCVLPVIALKILGFVGESRSDPRRVRKLGLVYALGVLVSFLALAAIVIGVKAAGHRAGWGMQFGSPIFVVCLTTLVMLVALNLFGVFEVNLSGRALDAASKLASKHGPAGAFFNGLLTTVLATSCTAPILGTALGFAFREGETVILLIFLTVGIGLAVPYVVLSWNPALLKFLPKPGAWMERFKIAMGFPMLATTVWLFLLAAGNFDKSRTLWFGLFLVALGLAAWIWGEFVQRGTKHRGLARVASILLAGGIGTYAFFQTPDQIEWQSWNPAAVAGAQAAGRPVLVDFTADWCVNCQVNKKIAIEVPSVRAKLKSMNAVALLGDYTHFTNTITAELNRFNRAGVPLVLVYPKNHTTPPIVLPEILTPGIVVNALDRAAQ
jgi:thiol:disulfide interchange protein DsbD